MVKKTDQTYILSERICLYIMMFFAIMLSVIIALLPIRIMRNYIFIFLLILFLSIAWVFLKGIPIYLKALFLLLSGYMILGRGFAYIGIGNLFIGEIITAFVILSLLISKKSQFEIMKFVREPIGKLAFFILILFGIYLTRGFIFYVKDSFRDCVLLYYVIFVFFGYLIGTNNFLLNKYLRFLSIVFPLCFFYGFTYPFGGMMRNISPVVNPGTRAFLFGHYTMYYVFIIGGIFYFLLLGRSSFRNKIFIIVGIISLLVLFSRAGYLAFLISIFTMGLLRIGFKYQFKIIACLLVILLIISFFGIFYIYIPTRPPFDLSLANITQRLVSIVSVAQWPKEDRIKWAKQVLGIWKNNSKSLLFGKGFGFNPGTRIRGFSPRMRYIHNSYVTSLLLTGAFGFLALFVFHGIFIRRVLLFLHRYNFDNERIRNIIAFLFLYYIAFMVVAFFGPLLECPFLAANLYFTMGVCIGTIKNSKKIISDNILG